MNQRIKELAEQAGIYNLNLVDETEYWILENFSKMIVRECARISKETCNELKADETIQMPALKTSLNLYHATLRNKLDEHFGVDE